MELKNNGSTRWQLHVWYLYKHSPQKWFRRENAPGLTLWIPLVSLHLEHSRKIQRNPLGHWLLTIPYQHILTSRHAHLHLAGICQWCSLTPQAHFPFKDHTERMRWAQFWPLQYKYERKKTGKVFVPHFHIKSVHLWAYVANRHLCTHPEPCKAGCRAACIVPPACFGDALGSRNWSIWANGGYGSVFFK